MKKFLIILSAFIFSITLLTILFFFCESLNEIQNTLLATIGGIVFVFGVAVPVIASTIDDDSSLL